MAYLIVPHMFVCLYMRKGDLPEVVICYHYKEHQTVMVNEDEHYRSHLIGQDVIGQVRMIKTMSKIVQGNDYNYGLWSKRVILVSRFSYIFGMFFIYQQLSTSTRY